MKIKIHNLLHFFLTFFNPKNWIYLAYWLIHVLGLLFFYQICRILFYSFNFQFFENLSFSEILTIFYGSLQFDVAAIFYTNIFWSLLIFIPLNWRFFLIQKNIFSLIFIFFNSLALWTNLIDIGYFPFTLKRTTADIVQEFQGQGQVLTLLLQFFKDYFYLILIGVILTFFLYIFTYFINFSTQKNSFFKQKTTWRQKIIEILIFFCVILIHIFGIRGDFKHSTRPLTLADAGRYVQESSAIALVLNTPFALIRSLGKMPLQPKNYFSDPKLFKQHIYTTHCPKKSVNFVKKNIVIIVLESFSAEFSALLNKDKNNFKGYTPFLDELMQKSYAFQYAFANGRRSIEALPSIIAGIPSVQNPFVLSKYAGNQTEALGFLLKKEGYFNAFFHGAPNGSMGFDAFMKLQKIDHYFGKNEYEKIYKNSEHFDGFWGIWDHHFFSFFADQLSTFPEPFFATFFSVSSHHPFQIPQEFQGKFEQGELVIHQSIAYTDFALRNFFKKIESEAWFNNTLFIITADHASAETNIKNYQNELGYFRIPLFFYDPSHFLTPKLEEQILAQQIDILPTILTYLNYPHPYFAFGKSLIEQNNEHEKTPNFIFNEINGTYQYLQNEDFLQWKNDEISGFFKFKTDLFLEENLINFAEKKSEISLNLQAFIQNYHERMIHNFLTLTQDDLKKCDKKFDN